MVNIWIIMDNNLLTAGVSENVVSTPLYPMVLLIIIPMKNGYFIGNIPYFQTNPYVSSVFIHCAWHLVQAVAIVLQEFHVVRQEVQIILGRRKVAALVLDFKLRWVLKRDRQVRVAHGVGDVGPDPFCRINPISQVKSDISYIKLYSWYANLVFCPLVGNLNLRLALNQPRPSCHSCHSCHSLSDLPEVINARDVGQEVFRHRQQGLLGPTEEPVLFVRENPQWIPSIPGLVK